MVDTLYNAGIYQWTRVEGVAPDKVPPISVNGYNWPFADNQGVSREEYAKAAYGCKMSHLHCIRDARWRGYKQILILEDDCGFHGLLADLPKFPDNWEIVQLAGNHIPRSFEKVDDNFIRIRHSLTTLAYAVHSHVFNLILETFPYSGLEIDVSYAGIIHHRGHSYCVTPHLCYSEPGYSDILKKEVDYSEHIKNV